MNKYTLCKLKQGLCSLVVATKLRQWDSFSFAGATFMRIEQLINHFDFLPTIFSTEHFRQTVETQKSNWASKLSILTLRSLAMLERLTLPPFPNPHCHCPTHTQEHALVLPSLKSAATTQL
jgi:hypothetical protein